MQIGVVYTIGRESDKNRNIFASHNLPINLAFFQLYGQVINLLSKRD